MAVCSGSPSYVQFPNFADVTQPTREEKASNEEQSTKTEEPRGVANMLRGFIDLALKRS